VREKKNEARGKKKETRRKGIEEEKILMKLRKKERSVGKKKESNE